MSDLQQQQQLLHQQLLIRQQQQQQQQQQPYNIPAIVGSIVNTALSSTLQPPTSTSSTVTTSSSSPPQVNANAPVVPSTTTTSASNTAPTQPSANNMNIVATTKESNLTRFTDPESMAVFLKDAISNAGPVDDTINYRKIADSLLYLGFDTINSIIAPQDSTTYQMFLSFGLRIGHITRIREYVSRNASLYSSIFNPLYPNTQPLPPPIPQQAYPPHPPPSLAPLLPYQIHPQQIPSGIPFNPYVNSILPHQQAPPYQQQLQTQPQSIYSPQPIIPHYQPSQQQIPSPTIQYPQQPTHTVANPSTDHQIHMGQQQPYHHIPIASHSTTQTTHNLNQQHQQQEHIANGTSINTSPTATDEQPDESCYNGSGSGASIKTDETSRKGLVSHQQNGIVLKNSSGSIIESSNDDDFQSTFNFIVPTFEMIGDITAKLMVDYQGQNKENNLNGLPFQGRKDIIQAINQYTLDRCRVFPPPTKNGTKFFIVSGASGLGKTKLLEEFGGLCRRKLAIEKKPSNIKIPSSSVDISLTYGSDTPLQDYEAQHPTYFLGPRILYNYLFSNIIGISFSTWIDTIQLKRWKISLYTAFNIILQLNIQNQQQLQKQKQQGSTQTKTSNSNNKLLIYFSFDNIHSFFDQYFNSRSQLNLSNGGSNGIPNHHLDDNRKTLKQILDQIYSVLINPPTGIIIVPLLSTKIVSIIQTLMSSSPNYQLQHFTLSPLTPKQVTCLIESQTLNLPPSLLRQPSFTQVLCETSGWPSLISTLIECCSRYTEGDHSNLPSAQELGKLVLQQALPFHLHCKVQYWEPLISYALTNAHVGNWTFDRPYAHAPTFEHLEYIGVIGRQVVSWLTQDQNYVIIPLLYIRNCFIYQGNQHFQPVKDIMHHMWADKRHFETSLMLATYEKVRESMFLYMGFKQVPLNIFFKGSNIDDTPTAKNNASNLSNILLDFDDAIDKPIALSSPKIPETLQANCTVVDEKTNKELLFDSTTSITINNETSSCYRFVTIFNNNNNKESKSKKEGSKIMIGFQFKQIKSIDMETQRYNALVDNWLKSQSTTNKYEFITVLVPMSLTTSDDNDQDNIQLVTQPLGNVIILPQKSQYFAQPFALVLSYYFKQMDKQLEISQQQHTSSKVNQTNNKYNNTPLSPPKPKASKQNAKISLPSTPPTTTTTTSSSTTSSSSTSSAPTTTPTPTSAAPPTIPAKTTPSTKNNNDFVIVVHTDKKVTAPTITTTPTTTTTNSTPTTAPTPIPTTTSEPVKPSGPVLSKQSTNTTVQNPTSSTSTTPSSSSSTIGNKLLPLLENYKTSKSTAPPASINDPDLPYTPTRKTPPLRSEENKKNKVPPTLNTNDMPQVKIEQPLKKQKSITDVNDGSSISKISNNSISSTSSTSSSSSRSTLPVIPPVKIEKPNDKAIEKDREKEKDKEKEKEKEKEMAKEKEREKEKDLEKDKEKEKEKDRSFIIPPPPVRKAVDSNKGIYSIPSQVLLSTSTTPPPPSTISSGTHFIEIQSSNPASKPKTLELSNSAFVISPSPQGPILSFSTSGSGGVNSVNGISNSSIGSGSNINNIGVHNSSTNPSVGIKSIAQLPLSDSQPSSSSAQSSVHMNIDTSQPKRLELFTSGYLAKKSAGNYSEGVYFDTNSSIPSTFNNDNSRDRDRDRDRERDRDRDGDRDRDRDFRDNNRDKDRDRGVDRDRDNFRDNNRDNDRDFRDRGGRNDRDRDRGVDRDRDNFRDNRDNNDRDFSNRDRAIGRDRSPPRYGGRRKGGR